MLKFSVEPNSTTTPPRNFSKVFETQEHSPLKLVNVEKIRKIVKIYIHVGFLLKISFYTKNVSWYDSDVWKHLYKNQDYIQESFLFNRVDQGLEDVFACSLYLINLLVG